MQVVLCVGWLSGVREYFETETIAQTALSGAQGRQQAEWAVAETDCACVLIFTIME